MGSALRALVQLLTYSRKNFFRSRNWLIAKAGRTTLASVATTSREKTGAIDGCSRCKP